MNNSEHLQWIHDRIVNVYGESENVDYLIKLREIIAEEKTSEESFKAYMDFVVKKREENKTDFGDKLEDLPK